MRIVHAMAGLLQWLAVAALAVAVMYWPVARQGDPPTSDKQAMGKAGEGSHGHKVHKGVQKTSADLRKLALRGDVIATRSQLLEWADSLDREALRHILNEQDAEGRTAVHMALQGGQASTGWLCLTLFGQVASPLSLHRVLVCMVSTRRLLTHLLPPS